MPPKKLSTCRVADAFDAEGTYKVTVNDNQNGTQPSPANLGNNDATDSDGMASGTNSVASVTVPGSGGIFDLDFRFTPPDGPSDGAVPTPCDFLTSGGFVVNDAGKKVSFGIHGGCKNGEFWGHLNVVDHATGYHINSTDITGYLVLTNIGNLYTREICGLATTRRHSWRQCNAFAGPPPGQAPAARHIKRLYRPAQT